MVKKILSFIVALCVINTCITDIYAVAYSPVNTASIDRTVVSADSFIPLDLGMTTDDIYIGSQKTIVNIQDLHADESTQKNIVSILEYLSKNYNVEKIYLEGATESLDFNWLRAIKDEKIRNEVTQGLLSDGKITGAELFGVYNQNKKIQFEGLENEQVYKRNFMILANMYKNRSIMANKMSEIKKYLNNAKKQIYNLSLKAIDDLVKGYNDRLISTNEYYSILIKMAKKKHVPSYKYETLTKYLDLEKKNRKIDFKKLNLQIVGATKELATKLSYEKYSNLTNLSRKYPLEYCRQLKQNISVQNLELEKYNEIFKYCDYISERNKINIELLLSEEKNILNILRKNFSKTVAQKHLIFLSEYSDRLSECFANEITSKDYNYVADNFDKYIILLENFVPKTDITEVERWYKIVNEFYSNNEKRNKIFLENIYKKQINENELYERFVIRNEKRIPFGEILNITKQPIDVVITGGYHSRGMKSLMDGLGVNYAIIMPSIGSADVVKSKNKFYENYMKQYSLLGNAFQQFLMSSNLKSLKEMFPDTDGLMIVVKGFLSYSFLQSVYNACNRDVENGKNILQDVLNSSEELASTLKTFSIDEKGNFILTFDSEGKERKFLVSQEESIEISDEKEIISTEPSIVKKSDTSEETGKKTKNENKIWRGLKRILILVFMAPFAVLFGSIPTGGGYGNIHCGKSVVNKGAKTEIGKDVVLIDTTFEKDADVSLQGKIKLNNVVVRTGNKLKITASQETTINMTDVDMDKVGELDINIQADGEFEIVQDKDNGIIKIYKVLRRFDISGSGEIEKALVAILKKGELVIHSETNWENENKCPIIIPYSNSASRWGTIEEVNGRSKIVYPSLSVRGSRGILLPFDIKGISLSFQEFLQRNNLYGKHICIDISLNDSFINEQWQKILTENFASITYLKTEVEYNFVFPEDHTGERERRIKEDVLPKNMGKAYNYHKRYTNGSDEIIRYPYSKSSKSVFDSFFSGTKGAFVGKTYMFIWPVESTMKYVRFRYIKPYTRVRANRQFKPFMQAAETYSEQMGNTIVLIPFDLRYELVDYFNDENILCKFWEIASSPSKGALYVAKMNGVTIILYESNIKTAHNEQYYLENLTAGFKFAFEYFKEMVDAAGYIDYWKEDKGKIDYIFEGEKTDDVYAAINKSLDKPYIKKSGRNFWILTNLRRALINYFLSVTKHFRGKWIDVETKLQKQVNLVSFLQSVEAGSSIGFRTSLVVPVEFSLLDSGNYGKLIAVLEKQFEGKPIRIPVYKYEYSNRGIKGIIYMVGITEEIFKKPNFIWQDTVLECIKTDFEGFLGERYFNNVVSFNGEPQITQEQTTSIFGNHYIPVVISENSESVARIILKGYDTIENMESLISSIKDSQTRNSKRTDGSIRPKYFNIAEDMGPIYKKVITLKDIVNKSFFGSINNTNGLGVGVKVSSDEHIFESAKEKIKFFEILDGTLLDFVIYVVRKNDLNSTYITDKETKKLTSALEHLIGFSKQLHDRNKKLILEYTFGFFDDSFEELVKFLKSEILVDDVKIKFIDLVDGIKLDLEGCTINDMVQKELALQGLAWFLQRSGKHFIVQCSDEIWNWGNNNWDSGCIFKQYNISRALSSKRDIFSITNDISSETNKNCVYEISPYGDEDEQDKFEFRLKVKKDYLKQAEDDGDPISPTLEPLLNGSVKSFLDNFRDTRFYTRIGDVIDATDVVSSFVIPANILYMMRRTEREEDKIEDLRDIPLALQALQCVLRQFKAERESFKDMLEVANELGTQENFTDLSDKQEEEIARILRKEGNESATDCVNRNFPKLFENCFLREDRIEVLSYSFLLRLYQTIVIKKFKQGSFGKPFKFAVTYEWEEDKVNERQQMFYSLLAHVYLYRGRENINIRDFFSISIDKINKIEDETIREFLKTYKSYIQSPTIKEINDLKSALQQTEEKESSLYIWIERLLLVGFVNKYKTEEIDPIPPVIPESSIVVRHSANSATISNVRKLLYNS